MIVLSKGWIMSKVLIVGGAGYVGGFLTDFAILKGHDVRVVDNLTYEDIFLKDVDFSYGDILDFQTIKPHLEWADTVIWLAGLVGDPACAVNPQLTVDLNVTSVKNLIENFSGRIIFPSTCSVYGAQHDELDEQSQVSPLSLYAETKYEAEQLLHNSSNSTLIFRLGTLFGLSDTYSRLRIDLVLNALTIRSVLERKMNVFGGLQFRPLLHVRDVGKAMVENIATNKEGIYNIHTENVTIIELANRIAEIVPNTCIEKTEIAFQDARNYRVNSDKAVRDLNFRPQWSIEDGISEIYDLVYSKRIKDITNPRFTNVETIRIFNSKKG